ncbi:MAG: selenium-dependent xanthine dehydrogenase [Candidatus Eisenbacteria bacterium]|uniref:Selenium-dependent xanthine dehydrogenase n=1 Tax=Eiseniibacteriota bacterium TaxID=2212470 RepID=A0A948RW07_UNCEI|nr:selenium-dependent xanthine dehydrogenase [Candidatus Eisenbacteria bacterium]MBU2692058.1 selenium-dependent xanthine dehydrogenase [Candidatus Eisenbacteria bacterium]
MEFLLNGAVQRVTTRPGETLLDTLRNRCGIRSIKDGCSPQGQCGCCLVLINGHPRTTCALPTERIQGKEILTLEGLPEEERRWIARSFVAAAGLQCGFCIPGIALRAKVLIDKNPNPTRAEIALALDGHLCRCTGYTKIIDAVELMARARREEFLPEPCADGRVGDPLARYRGEDLVLGQRPYVADLHKPGMLHGAVLLSPHARAKVLKIETSRAEALPGVKAVITAADVPGERWYGLIHNDWPGFVSIGEEVRCVGDILAAVAAIDEATAREARDLIAVEYEVLEPVLDPISAMRDECHRVNPRHANILSRTEIKRGNVEEALKASAHVACGTWETQRIEHLFLETECALAEVRPGGKLTLYTQGQGIFDDRRQVAGFLNIPEDDVFVELVPNGGAFGGKEDISIQTHAALLAWMTQKPVMLALSREESIRIHPKRHPLTLHYTLGCDNEGHFTALKAKIVGDTGAYASVGDKVLERAAGHACGPYRVPAVDLEATAVCTNNPPSGAMRGFGANQAHFAMEGCIDQLCSKTGIDPWDMRWRNAVEVGDMLSTGQILEASVGVKKTLTAVKGDYDEARAQGRAVGIACGIKNSGIGNGVLEWGKARLVVEKDGTITLYNGYTEMGQGLLTVLIQCAVEVTGLPAARFRPRVDTTYALGCGQTTGSRATLFGGRAVKSAAEKLKKDLDREGSLSLLTGRVYAADVLVDDTTALGAPVPKIKTHTAYGYATQLCILDETGRVKRMVAAHDVGRVINPALCEGQIQGAIHMGLGYALTEELPCPDGMPATFTLRELGVLRAKDMPEIKVILIEEHEPEGPFGAKGVGEIGLVPTAAAVAGALEAYDGIRRTRLPMKDSPAAHAMSVGRIRARRGRSS